MDFIIEGSLAFTEFHILSTSNVLLHLYLEHISRGSTSNVTLCLDSPPQQCLRLMCASSNLT